MKLDNKGFSLVEIMLAVVVSTLVLGVITAMIGFAARSSRETNERVELHFFPLRNHHHQTSSMRKHSNQSFLPDPPELRYP